MAPHPCSAPTAPPSTPLLRTPCTSLHTTAPPLPTCTRVPEWYAGVRMVGDSDLQLDPANPPRCSRGRGLRAMSCHAMACHFSCHAMSCQSRANHLQWHSAMPGLNYLVMETGFHNALINFCPNIWFKWCHVGTLTHGTLDAP